MQWKSTPQRYGAVAIAVHWITAAAILALLSTGFSAEDMTDPEEKAARLRVHVMLGLAVLALTVFRLGWWALADRRPAPAAGTPRWQAAAAHLVHGLFYLAIFGMVASGLAMMALSGAGPVVFGGADGPLPDFRDYLPRLPHGIGARLMLALMALHVGAALHHQFVRRDRLLARIGLGR